MPIWQFIDEKKEINSLKEIERGLKMSYNTVLEGIKVLESIGYVKLVGKREKKVVKTEKFFATRKTIKELSNYFSKR